MVDKFAPIPEANNSPTPYTNSKLKDMGDGTFARSVYSASPNNYLSITPSDDTLLSGIQFIRVGGAGNIALKGVNPDSSVVTIAVSGGEYLPFGSGYIMAATTATSIVGFSL